MNQLYSYWRSSAAYRVRIALNMKGLGYEVLPINLMQKRAGDEVSQIGQHHSQDYQQLNPAQLVPCFVDEKLALNDINLNQSLAIIEYLEDCYPSPAILPHTAIKKAQVRAFALDIACEIHPLNNLRVLHYLSDNLGISEAQKIQWYHHWLHCGFANIETRLRQHAGHFCFANQMTLADICLIPQVYNALRFKLDMTPYSTIHRLYHHCLSLPAFFQASPEQQSDAEVNTG